MLPCLACTATAAAATTMAVGSGGGDFPCSTYLSGGWLMFHAYEEAHSVEFPRERGREVPLL